MPLTDFADVLEEQQPWFEGDKPTLRELAEQARRINEADLSYPIIISAEGRLMDGKHRLAKAYVMGLSEINAVQFVTNPAPNYWIPAQGKS